MIHDEYFLKSAPEGTFPCFTICRAIAWTSCFIVVTRSSSAAAKAADSATFRMSPPAIGDCLARNAKSMS
jgi:hypothetical protein